MPNIFYYTGTARKGGQLTVNDIVVVTMSAMPEVASRAVWWLSEYAYTSKHVDTMYNPLYIFRIKSLKPKTNHNDHIPGF